METRRMYIVTWNIAEQLPPEDVDLTELLSLNKRPDLLPDVYAIGLQEAKVQRLTGQWSKLFRDKLSEHHYIEIHAVHMLGVVLYVFVREEHASHVRNMESSSTATGFFRFMPNKGAVVFRMDLYGVSVCLVNCHLRPHDENLQERIDNYNTIVADQVFQHAQTKQILFHDYVLWFGDLNFRLQGDTQQEELIQKVRAGQLDELLRLDELTYVREKNEAFAELNESPITFPPTFKFEKGTDNYSLKRRLAWTDRVLFKVLETAYEQVTLSMDQTSYTSMASYKCSDHAPVVAAFNFKVFSDHSDRDVKFKDVGPWLVSEANTVHVYLPSDLQPSPSDVVALYTHPIADVQEILASVPVQPSCPLGERSGSGRLKVALRFEPFAVDKPGVYRLLYLTNPSTSSSILGISKPFAAEYVGGVPPVSWSVLSLPSSAFHACQRAASTAVGFYTGIPYNNL